jgi:cysteine-rich repeat protein
MIRRAFPDLSRFALLAVGVVTALFACTATPAVKEERLCAPGDYVFCRCRDREEGSKLCKDDGVSFGPCEPCESLENPEGPLEPGDPGNPFEDDSGIEAGVEKPKTCGNGIVESGEDCDDDNTNETDGCDTGCKLAGLAPQNSNACPGLAVHVWGGAHTPTVSGTTAGSGNRTATPICGPSSGSIDTSGAAGPDRVYEVVAHKTGTLTVAVTDTDYNAFVYVSESCGPGNIQQVACSNKVDGAGNETVSLPVEADKKYYVFVDGSLPKNLDTTKLQGTYRVTFSIP